MERTVERNTIFSDLPILSANQVYLLMGFTLMMLYLTQLFLNLRWEWLADLQNDEVYKQFTGFLLLVYVVMQGRLGLKRLRRSSDNISTLFYYHKIQGVFGPLIFYIHSIDVGFAYQMILTFVFLGNSIVGYLSPHAISIKNKVYVLSWTVLHIGLAIMTFVLMFFHMFVVYYYS